MSHDLLLIDYPLPQIARLSLNRPDKHNAFNDVLIAEVTKQLRKLDQDEAIRVVILTGKGVNFSAGADVEWMQQMVKATEEENYADALALAELMQTLNNFSKPTIAAIQGAVMGGAVGLVACCDIALATSESYFCFSEVKLGLIPAVISPYIIKAIGERQTRRYFLTAEKISAEKAQQLGLIHECVAAQQHEAAALKLASNLLRHSPAALMRSKQLIQHVAKHDMDAQLIHYTAEMIAKIRVSKQGQEGLQAFLEKREPRW